LAGWLEIRADMKEAADQALSKGGNRRGRADGDDAGEHHEFKEFFGSTLIP